MSLSSTSNASLFLIFCRLERKKCSFFRWRLRGTHCVWSKLKASTRWFQYIGQFCQVSWTLHFFDGRLFSNPLRNFLKLCCKENITKLVSNYDILSYTKKAILNISSKILGKFLIFWTPGLRQHGGSGVTLQVKPMSKYSILQSECFLQI